MALIVEASSELLLLLSTVPTTGETKIGGVRDASPLKVEGAEEDVPGAAVAVAAAAAAEGGGGGTGSKPTSLLPARNA